MVLIINPDWSDNKIGQNARREGGESKVYQGRPMLVCQFPRHRCCSCRAPTDLEVSYVPKR